MDSILSVSNKNFSGNGKEFTKDSRAVRKAESDLGGIDHGTIVHQRLIDLRRMDLRKERYKEQRKELLLCCGDLVLMENGGRTSCQMEKHIMKGDLENHSKARSFRLAPWLNITRFLRKTSQGSSIREESVTWKIPWRCIVCR